MYRESDIYEAKCEQQIMKSNKTLKMGVNKYKP